MDTMKGETYSIKFLNVNEIGKIACLKYVLVYEFQKL